LKFEFGFYRWARLRALEGQALALEAAMSEATRRAAACLTASACADTATGVGSAATIRPTLPKGVSSLDGKVEFCRCG
jgi:hypothetical protein